MRSHVKAIDGMLSLKFRLVIENKLLAYHINVSIKQLSRVYNIAFYIDCVKIECHTVGDTWWQPLLSYGK